MLFGHDWGRQENIRDAPIADEVAVAIPLVVILSAFGAGPKDCDRTCLRCQKTKTFRYDHKRGQ